MELKEAKKKFKCERRTQLSPERGLRPRSQRPNLSEVYSMIPCPFHNVLGPRVLICFAFWCKRTCVSVNGHVLV